MNQLNPIKYQSEVFDRAIMDQIECQTYGITVAQVKTCIEWHGGDYLEYVASVAKLAQRHANDLPPSPAAEAIRVLINRIALADKLSQQEGAY